jgi:hypothetical protein
VCGGWETSWQRFLLWRRQLIRCQKKKLIMASRHLMQLFFRQRLPERPRKVFPPLLEISPPSSSYTEVPSRLALPGHAPHHQPGSCKSQACKNKPIECCLAYTNCGASMRIVCMLPEKKQHSGSKNLAQFCATSTEVVGRRRRRISDARFANLICSILD